MTRRLTLVLLAVLALLAGCSSDGPPKGEGGKPAELRIAYQAIPNGDLVVKHERLLESRLGIPVQWRRYSSGAEVNTAMSRDEADIALVGSTSVAMGIPAGLKYKIVWIHDVIGAAEALVARPGSGIRSVGDLSGKTVAVPFASTAHYALLAAIDREGGVDLNEVDAIDLQPDKIAAAWKDGTIDAAYVWQPTLGALTKEGGTIVLTSAELADDGIITGDAGVVSTALIERYPDVVQTWVDAQAEAVTMITADPGRAEAAIAAELDSTPEQVRGEMTGYTYLPAQTQATPRYLGGPDSRTAQHLAAAAVFLKGYPQVTQFLKEYDVYKPDPTAADFTAAIDTRFLTEAAK